MIPAFLRPKTSGDLARLGVLVALAALILFATLRYDKLPLAFQHIELPALQLHVCADRARHVLRHHHRRHRSLGRRGGGVGLGGLGLCLALWLGGGAGCWPAWRPGSPSGR